jgi:hypothetical protein
MELTPRDRLKPDLLAVWYLRLNGVFTISNFILHPDRPGSARTDADIAGVRFSNRNEFGNPDADDEWFRDRPKLTAIIAEVKTGACAINGPWSNPQRENMQKIFASLGWFADEAKTAATNLYDRGVHNGMRLSCSLFCIGNEESQEVKERFAEVPQRTWQHITQWIYHRFDRYEDIKSDHTQWDYIGRAIWDHFQQSHDAAAFEVALRERFLLPPSQSPRPAARDND